VKKSCVARVRNTISVGACKFAKQNLECGGKGVEKWWKMFFFVFQTTKTRLFGGWKINRGQLKIQLSDVLSESELVMT